MISDLTHYKLEIDLSFLYEGGPKGPKDLKVELYDEQLERVSRGLLDLSRRVAVHREIKTLYKRLRNEGPLLLKDLQEVAHIGNCLIDQGYAIIEWRGEGARLILGNSIPPMEHPQGLTLWKIDLGIATYWAALEDGLEGQALLDHVTRLISDAEVGIGEVFEELEDDPVTLEELFRYDREGAMKTYLRMDGELPPVEPLWTVFCRTKQPGVIGCSEW